MDDMTGVFKTAAFGGFQKDDVLHFIEMQKQTEADLRAAVAEMDGRLRDLTERCRVLTEEKNAMKNELEENRGAREAASSFAIRDAEYRALEAKFHSLEEQNRKTQEENEQLRRSLEQAEQSGKPSPQETMPEMSLEEKVGSAFVDARRFADQLVSEARQTATDANAVTARFVADTEKKAQLLSAELRLCAEKCENLFSGVEADVERLRTALKNVSDEIG